MNLGHHTQPAVNNPGKNDGHNKKPIVTMVGA
jgi:hypothetical protein